MAVQLPPNPYELLHQKVIRDTMTFSQARSERNRKIRSRVRLLAPDAPQGFELNVLQRICNFDCNVDLVDSDATLSLSLIATTDISDAAAYADKLDVMCVNAARLAYSAEVMSLMPVPNAHESAVKRALDFYVRCDVSRRPLIYSKFSQSNETFSDLLHRLKSCGYVEYIFDLARVAGLSVDLVYKPSLLYRYTNQDRYNGRNGWISALRTTRRDCDAGARLERGDGANEYDVLTGYLWYVQASRTPRFAVAC